MLKSLITGVRIASGLCVLPPGLGAPNFPLVFDAVLSFDFFGDGLACWQLLLRDVVCRLYLLAEGLLTFPLTWSSRFPGFLTYPRRSCAQVFLRRFGLLLLGVGSAVFVVVVVAPPAFSWFTLLAAP